MIRVAIVDDHHAIRLGLQTALAAEHDLIPVGTASTAAELTPLLYRTDPDIVLLDYHLPDRDGLTVCREIKASVPAPGVVLYSAFADASMTVPAIVAGADGLIYKGVRPQELFTAIRTVAEGGNALPRVSPSLLEAAGLALDADDLPILAMLVNRTSPGDIAATLAIDHVELRHRVRRMLGRLRVPVPEPRTPLVAGGRRDAADVGHHHDGTVGARHQRCGHRAQQYGAKSAASPRADDEEQG